MVPEAAEARELADAIASAPLAAMVLVQVLRTTEGLDVPRALLVESLAYRNITVRRRVPPLARADREAARPQRPWSQVPRCCCSGGPALGVRLNRPARRNALSVEMRDALVEALELVAADGSIAAVTVSGEGKCFSAGGDLAEFGSAPDAAVAHAVRSARSVPALLAGCAQRLTFRVHGAAVGAGAEMAAFGGRVLATPDAFFQLPRLRYGLIPGSGGCMSIRVALAGCARPIWRCRAPSGRAQRTLVGAHRRAEWSPPGDAGRAGLTRAATGMRTRRDLR